MLFHILKVFFIVSQQTSSKKTITRYEKHKRAFAEKKKYLKTQKAVAMSIEGRNMGL